jgi:hypothetical protein
MHFVHVYNVHNTPSSMAPSPTHLLILATEYRYGTFLDNKYEYDKEQKTTRTELCHQIFLKKIGFSQRKALICTTLAIYTL